LAFPPELPISSRADEIVAAITEHRVVVLAGETGSGKTTQIPKLCLAAGRGGRGRIACTQPRRVAALSVSRRVAEEMGVRWGGPVGCKVRFEDRTSRGTVVKFMTDGMLLAEVQADPALREYDTLIIDEAHERSLNIDFLLGHLRRLVLERPELRVVITSATIDTAAFSKAFEDAPVIEVSGRTFPVEVVYAPLDEMGEENERADALHYIDGAVEAAGRVLAESRNGDLLIFMPAERDIRETIDALAKVARGCDVIPLFGRLTNAEQQRVFAPTTRRRIIVATNIAETSLTLPGIRYVIDTGLARISRYAPGSRTRRLPIEAVARSSADQRKGRAGRVAEGVCIRLYSEKDYLERPRFAQPEIQRANLADVILRMKAFGLGDIERFPFINQPAAKAVRAGYALLEELHAIERDGSGWQLTEVGHRLAGLPVDPSVGRMILQARHEKALREAVIVAAGLSIQDPRERPLDQQAAADAAHRRFTHPESDFLTLLAIWETLHDEFETLSQSKMRRWCRAHFLSYPRMREWRDIHAQLHEVLRSHRDLGESSVWAGTPAADNPAEATLRLHADHPAYRALHRSILAGLLGNIAHRDDEKGGYKATHERRAHIFPGSGLFVREEKKTRKGEGAKAAKDGKSGKSPRWVMSAEFMETSRLFARTCARLDPRWVLDLGAHLLKRHHRDPFWDETKGRVMVRQRTTLYGLEVELRAVGYGKIDPAAATDIFIREGLVNDTITWPFDFLRHNREVRTRLENELTRMRDRGMMNLEEAIWRFYHTRLVEAGHHVSAVGELIALVKEQRAHDRRFLEFEAEDLNLGTEATADQTAFPENLPLANAVLPLSYHYKPGETEDGVTVQVEVAAAEHLSARDLDWAVPGHLGAKIEHYLKALPKELRRLLVPLAATTEALREELAAASAEAPPADSLEDELARRLGSRCGVRIDSRIWAERPLPEHLRVRVEVRDGPDEVVVASRDLTEIKAGVSDYLSQAGRRRREDRSDWWRTARAEWETGPLEDWPDRDLPTVIEVSGEGGTRIKAHPALTVSGGQVRVRLYRSEEEAAVAWPAGLRALLRHVLRRDLAWLEKDLKALKTVGPLAASFYPWEELRADAQMHLERNLCDPGRVPEREGVRRADDFSIAAQAAKTEARKSVPALVDRLERILALRQELLVHAQPYPKLEDDVEILMGRGFLRTVDPSRLTHFERYLRARLQRAERWRQDPARDTERVRQLEPCLKALGAANPGPARERLRWLVEEYRVSLWAQKLGTAEPVSAKKLERTMRDLQTGSVDAAVARAAPAPKPLVVAPVRDKKKGKPLKSLNALGGLFKPPGS
jgi:ATP-dependent helicase HrpA